MVFLVCIFLLVLVLPVCETKIVDFALMHLRHARTAAGGAALSRGCGIGVNSDWDFYFGWFIDEHFFLAVITVIKSL